MVALSSNWEEADSILQAMEKGAHISVPKEYWGALCVLVGGRREAYNDESLGAAYRLQVLRKACRPGGHARAQAWVTRLAGCCLRARELGWSEDLWTLRPSWPEHCRGSGNVFLHH